MKETELIETIRTGTEAEALSALKKYGGERYMKGATNFAKLVRDMRYKQKQTSKTAEDLEKQVDRAITAILGER